MWSLYEGCYIGYDNGLGKATVEQRSVRGKKGYHGENGFGKATAEKRTAWGKKGYHGENGIGKATAKQRNEWRFNAYQKRLDVLLERAVSDVSPDDEEGLMMAIKPIMDAFETRVDTIEFCSYNTYLKTDKNKRFTMKSSFWDYMKFIVVTPKPGEDVAEAKNQAQTEAQVLVRISKVCFGGKRDLFIMNLLSELLSR